MSLHQENNNGVSVHHEKTKQNKTKQNKSSGMRVPYENRRKLWGDCSPEKKKKKNQEQWHESSL